MDKIPLNVVIRNFELRLVERIPINDPLKGVHLAKSSWSPKEFAKLLHDSAFKTDIKEAGKKHNLSKAYMSKCSFDKLEQETQDSISQAMKNVGLEFIVRKGDPFFGGGGLYNYSLTFT